LENCCAVNLRSHGGGRRIYSDRSFRLLKSEVVTVDGRVYDVFGRGQVFQRENAKGGRVDSRPLAAAARYHKEPVQKKKSNNRVNGPKKRKRKEALASLKKNSRPNSQGGDWPCHVRARAL